LITSSKHWRSNRQVSRPGPLRKRFTIFSPLGARFSQIKFAPGGCDCDPTTEAKVTRVCGMTFQEVSRLDLHNTCASRFAASHRQIQSWSDAMRSMSFLSSWLLPG
jgi:hypothetical protein